MKEITLTQGMVAIVDDGDYEMLARHKWCLSVRRRLYAQTRIVAPDGRAQFIRMHRLLLGAQPGQQVDHANLNGLDNRRSNLRLCSPSQNQYNRRKSPTNRNNANGVPSSRYKGVSWDTRRQLWRAELRSQGQRHFLGYFSDELVAARAYDEAAQKYFGDFARVNITWIRAEDCPERGER